MRTTSPSGGGGTVVLDEANIRKEKRITEICSFLSTVIKIGLINT
jgi:hypothetical protein